MKNSFSYKKKNSDSVQFFLLIASFTLILSACNEPFQAVGDDEAYTFSIYGYLDASVDTQWVRITPFRHQLSQPPEKPAMMTFG